METTEIGTLPFVCKSGSVSVVARERAVPLWELDGWTDGRADEVRSVYLGCYEMLAGDGWLHIDLL